METQTIQSALISVYHKEGLAPILKEMDRLGIQIFSTGGTYDYIVNAGYSAHKVEDLTGYPSILGGRVKTLHPKVFGGILAKRDDDHLSQLANYDIPAIDLVIVDLYPFEETVASTDDESAIIEKIDIGGIALIRAAAKNFKDVVIVPERGAYADITAVLEAGGTTTMEQRKHFAARAFDVSSHYDSAIYNYFAGGEGASLKMSGRSATALRYGENPHQAGTFYGNLEDQLEQKNGKALSYNNLVDIDAAMQLMAEFEGQNPTVAVLKHTNPCGLAQRQSIHEAWTAALAGDPVSAFGGIIIMNTEVDLATAEGIDAIFYEVVIAPSYSEEAMALLTKKKKRIVLEVKHWNLPDQMVKTCLNGFIGQDRDASTETSDQMTAATEVKPDEAAFSDLVFANIACKHLKSNAIALVKDRQLVGIGCGQTSRVDALRQAVAKAKHFKFDLNGSVMASDAFFPFADCVEIAHHEGITAVVQPGGSIRDQESIDYCDRAGMSMVMTGVRHFKH